MRQALYAGVALMGAGTIGGCATETRPAPTPLVDLFYHRGEPVSLSKSQLIAIQKAVRASLKDPESARFGSIGATKSDKGVITACGMVNAKNSFGGYTGEKEFVGLVLEPHTDFVVQTIASDTDSTELTNGICSRIGVEL
jgi:hypothetical protein